MITVGTKVSIIDFTDFFLDTGIVKKIKKNTAVIIFPGKSGEYIYALENLEEVKEKAPHKKKKKKA